MKKMHITQCRYNVKSQLGGVAHFVALLKKEHEKMGLLVKERDKDSLINSFHSDIIHIEGAWTLFYCKIASYARKHKIPYVISPHGSYLVERIRQKYFKKRIALFVYQKRELKKANCIHVTCIQEAKDIFAMKVNCPIAIIPNGIDISQYKIKDKDVFLSPERKRNLLFLSWILPIKGLELLLESWSKVDNDMRKGWNLVIAGDGKVEYIAKIKKMISDLGLSDSVAMIGAISGDSKMSAYRDADVFVLPSYSENFAYVVTEALACGTPVITTTGTPWEELVVNKCGWWINLSVENLVSAIENALRMDMEELLAMGQRGRQLVESKYTIQKTAVMMKELYEWIVSGSIDKPDFIVKNDSI